VTSIGERVFLGCSGLTNIAVESGNSIYHSEGNCLIETASKTLILGCKNSVIPTDGSVTSIGYAAFSGCSGLTSITIPSGLTSVGNEAFYDCSSLTSITIPDGVINIGEYAFSGCNSLTSITIPNGVINIGNYTFCDCSSLTSITIPDSVTNIGDYAFAHCNSLTSITIPDSVTNIGYDAFSSCSSLTSITIPNSVTSIGNYAFHYCSSLTSITIPSGMMSIEDGTFYSCSSLTSVTIGDSVKSIGNYAFEYCYKLVEVYNLSNLNITKGSEDNGYAGYYALDIYTSKECVSKLHTVDDYIFYEDGETVYLIDYTGAQTELTLPDKYNNKNYSIYQYAFYNYGSLTSVIIPSGVTNIGGSAFYCCYRLVEVYNLSTLNISIGSYNNGYIGYYAKVIHTSLDEKSYLTITDDGFIFYDNGTNCYLVGYVGSKTSLILPDNFNGNKYDINQYAFYNCSSLSSITIPDDVASIGNYAFEHCSGLRSITIGNGVTSIGDDAFWDCSSLTSVVIPSSVTIIGSYSFYYCSSLTSVVIPSSVTIIGEYAFYGCGGLTIITIPNSVTSIGKLAFYGCGNLESVTIPDSVISIGDRAFNYCDNLEDVYYGGTSAEWQNISISSDNSYLTSATRYYYSEEEPMVDGNWWHYVDGEVVVWGEDN
jgi:hypothetical protein